MKAITLLGLALPSALALNIPSQQTLFSEGLSRTSVVKPSGRETCPQAPKVVAPNDGLHSSLHFLQDEAFRARQAQRLSRAVQVPTTVGDFMTDPYDEAFEPVVRFQELLKEMFPLVHKHAELDHINRLGLVYTFQGIDTTRKPLLFMAHQDVVPIDDPSDWTYPPFDGHFDGEWIWGRGSSDCKNVLIGLMSAAEELLSQDWRPQRTIVFAFGFDEESHGFLGAGSIAPVLEKKYGKDSFELILDEGGLGLQSVSSDPNSSDEVVYALPGVGEKGSLDLVMDLAVPGGHSSIPPAHTGIGIMAEILYKLEHEDLFSPRLDPSHPSHGMLECQARYSPSAVEPWLADKLAEGDAVALAEAVAQSRGPAVRYTLQTSQAADLIKGGVKTNALPEKISAVVNYRVALHSTPDELVERAVKIIRPIAESHNVSLKIDFPGMTKTKDDFFGGSGDRTLTLSPLSVPLNPAPISPTDPLTSKIWARFAGVARSVFESHPNPMAKTKSTITGAEAETPTVVVTGDIMTGNTDTRFYWSLSENIYRWSPSRNGGVFNIHTVDERIRLDVHLEGLMLYYDLIRSFDGWDESSE